jgi:hypothetical protein
MGALRCVDGSVLSVQAVTCRDSAGQPYEITLRLARDSVPFAAVGQRCGYQFSELAARVSAARADPEQAAAWPDPDDRFPGAYDGPESARLPGDHEYFTLRSRDRSDLPGTGELRCVLRSTAVWLGECMGIGYHGEPATGVQHLHQAPRGSAGQRIRPARRPAGGPGRWHLTRRAFIEAWGDGGVGVRAVLTSAELVAFLDTVLTEPESPQAAGAAVCAGSVPAGGIPAARHGMAGPSADSSAMETQPAHGQ